jgi:hypothetical protein
LDERTDEGPAFSCRHAPDSRLINVRPNRLDRARWVEESEVWRSVLGAG